MKLTLHAQQRINGRLSEITNVHEIMDACNQISDYVAYEVVIVRKLDKMVIIKEDADEQKCSKGDELVAICRNGNVCTVMLRKSWSKSNNY